MNKKTISKDKFIKRFTALSLSRLSELPQNNEARQILLKSLSLGFEYDTTYTEKQVNEIIISWINDLAHISGTDHVYLRRSLIDYNYLSRTANGQSYRREEAQPNVPLDFDADIDKVSLKEELDKAAAEAEAKKQYYMNLKENK